MTITKKNRLAANKSNSESTNGSGKELKLIVTEGLTVSIRPNPLHEFLMTGKEVAIGYGASEYSIRMAKMRNAEDLKEGKHFVTARTICPSDAKGVTNCYTLANAQPNQVFWTKRGVVRLGMFIKSPNARLFRDWAEDLIIEKLEAQGKLFDVPVTKQVGGKQKYNGNRLTLERENAILREVMMVEDIEVRRRITNLVSRNNHA